MVTINVITPMGGSSKELLETYGSLVSCSNNFKFHATINWFVVFNNNVYYDQIGEKFSTEKFSINILDINPQASRSAARNAALSEIKKTRELSWVVFLDAGDLLCADLFKNCVMKNEIKLNILHFGYSKIENINNTVYLRRHIPLAFKHIINPFYLGSAFVSSDLAISEIFPEGTKEDWKYWIKILRRRPSINFHKAVAYVYRIESNVTHIKRKAKLFREQMLFFNQFLGYSIFISCMLLVLHCLLLVVIWLTPLNIKKIEKHFDRYD